MKDIVATGKEKANEILGYRSVIGLAGVVGLIGGILLGVWDCITVIVDRGISFSALRVILSLFLYSVAIYAVIGCLGMAVIGAVSGILIRTGKYSVNRLQLARVFIGVFILLAVSVLLSENIIFGNIIDITESTVISILSGVGLAGLIMYALAYALNMRIRKEKLIALCISLFVSILVLLYGGMLVNLSLLPRETFYQPISLLTNIGLLIVVCLMAVGLYVLSLSILQRCNPGGIRRTGYVLLTIILCAFVAISFIGPFSAKASQKPPIVASGDLKGKPNILWIVMDTVRADHLSCYGYYRNTTPNIDKIASEGTLYENAISTAPWTTPSHASMLTGMFPSKHGVDAEWARLEGDFQTIAEVLRLNSYKTFGYSNNQYFSPKQNLSQGFSTFVTTPHGLLEAGSELADYLKVSDFKRKIYNHLLMNEGDEGTKRTNKVVKRWIADAHQARTPFFLFINYMEPHHPYHPPRDYVMPYSKEEGVSYKEAMSVSSNGWDYMAGKLEITDEDFDIILARYDGEYSYLDFKMGQLFDYLRELNIMDNTVLIITSDHGENFGEHHLMSHTLCVYDTLIHVPLIIRYPKSFEAGLRVNEQVQLTDIFPTILDIVGINWDGEEELQGYSLLRDREKRPLKFAIAEFAFSFNPCQIMLNRNSKFDISSYVRRLKTVRTDEYKYIWASDGQDELYNIRLDPAELENIIEAEPGKAEELKALLIEWLNSFEPYRPEAAKKVR